MNKKLSIMPGKNKVLDKQKLLPTSSSFFSPLHILQIPFSLSVTKEELFQNVCFHSTQPHHLLCLYPGSSHLTPTVKSFLHSICRKIKLDAECISKVAYLYPRRGPLPLEGGGALWMRNSVFHPVCEPEKNMTYPPKEMKRG